ncbi:hypothetical protein [Marinobacter changyiensis]|uniref:hypothetical protein n=1 Tax=Marinobacter changyiensis TaxID=2604091 RepID=UPI00126408F7|nr:hypothetical protein [Marinobacter changyiensis]
MSQSNYTGAEILKNRELLMDIELLLNPLRGSLYDNDDDCETKVVGAALANSAHTHLLTVLAWLEDMQDKAEEADNGEA